MRGLLPFVVAAVMMVGLAGSAERDAPGESAIRDLLLRVRHWKVLFDFTPSSTPTATAYGPEIEFFRRGDRLVGRTTNMLGNMNCEIPFELRADGFDFGKCDGNSNLVLVDVYYDPIDPLYTFKRLSAPQKVWISPITEIEDTGER